MLTENIVVWGSMLLLVVFVVVVAYLFKSGKLYEFFPSERMTSQKSKEKIYFHLDNKFSQNLIEDEHDIEMVKSSIERESGDLYSISSLLEDYLLHMSAFLFEEGVEFPKKSDINIKELQRNIDSEMNVDFVSQGILELESLYFNNTGLAKRRNRLMSISSNSIFRLLKFVEYY